MLCNYIVLPILIVQANIYGLKMLFSYLKLTEILYDIYKRKYVSIKNKLFKSNKYFMHVFFAHSHVKTTNILWLEF